MLGVLPPQEVIIEPFLMMDGYVLVRSALFPKGFEDEVCYRLAPRAMEMVQQAAHVVPARPQLFCLFIHRRAGKFDLGFVMFG